MKMSIFSRARIYPRVVVCAILLLSFYGIVASQVKTEKQGFSVNPRAQFLYEFALQSVGKVTITARWEGRSPAILTLKYPFGKTYGYKMGTTPLNVVLQVTKQLLEKGGEWRIIFNNESQLKTKGTITITYSTPTTPTPTKLKPPKEEKSEQGWCCKDGRIFTATEEECRERRGQFFPNREEAERHCRGEQPPMEEGWCCRDGRIFPAPEEECREQGGQFFPSREEAERHCLEEHPKLEQKEKSPLEKHQFRDRQMARELIDIVGIWNSNIQRIYEIEQNQHDFTWKVRGTNEQAKGKIEGNRLFVSWHGEFGTGSAEGSIIEIDPNRRAQKIEWMDGTIFFRQDIKLDKPHMRKSAFNDMEHLPREPEVKEIIYKEDMLKMVRHFSLKKVYNEWVKTGGPIGGLGYDVRYLSNEKKGRNVMFVTDNNSGVNKSVDGGKNWFASNKGITARFGDSRDAIPVFCLTVDPNNSNIVWVGLKDVKGVYKSYNAGKSWTEVTPYIKEKEFVFRGFTVMPGNSNIVYAAGELPTNIQGKEFAKVKGRVYLTENGGKSWTKIRDEKDLCRYIIIHPQNHNIIYVSCGIFDREASNSKCKSSTLLGSDLPLSYKDRGGVGILKSTTGGKPVHGKKKWKILNRKNGLKDLYIGSLVMHPTNPDILLAGAGNNSASPYRVASKTHYTGGVFRTTNSGETWIQTLKDEIITSVEFSPSSPNIAYAGGRQHFYISENAGRTWQMIAGHTYPWGPPGVVAGFPIDILVDPVDPYTLFANNYGGGNVKSTDGGKTWTIASQGCTGAIMFDLSLHPFNPDIVYASARSGAFVSFQGGLSWKGLSHSPARLIETYSIAVSPKNPQIVLASQELMGKLYCSTDGGNSWNMVHWIPVTQDPLDSHGFKRIVFAPSNPDVVYAGACRGSNHLEFKKSSCGIHKSVQGGIGKSWKQANDSSTKDKSVNDLAVHPNNHNVVYAATVTGGLYKTISGGKKWIQLKAFTGKDVRSVAIRPDKPDFVFAGLQDGGVYCSQNGGKTWHKMAAGMEPNERVWSLVVDPFNPNAVWAGTTRSGVYKYDSIEQQWIKVNKGLRMRTVVDLEISKDGRILYAATSGEGVFRFEKKPK